MGCFHKGLRMTYPNSTRFGWWSILGRRNLSEILWELFYKKGNSIGSCWSTAQVVCINRCCYLGFFEGRNHSTFHYKMRSCKGVWIYRLGCLACLISCVWFLSRMELFIIRLVCYGHLVFHEGFWLWIARFSNSFHMAISQL